MQSSKSGVKISVSLERKCANTHSIRLDTFKIQIPWLAETTCQHRFHPAARQLWLFTLLLPHCARGPSSCVGVGVSASCCCRTLHRPPSKRKQKDGARDAKGGGGGHQRPSPSTVSTCRSIPVLTADEALHKQPAQILPAGRSHSTSLGVVYGRVGGQREGN